MTNLMLSSVSSDLYKISWFAFIEKKILKEFVTCFSLKFWGMILETVFYRSSKKMLTVKSPVNQPIVVWSLIKVDVGWCLRDRHNSSLYRLRLPFSCSVGPNIACSARCSHELIHLLSVFATPVWEIILKLCW